MQSKCGFVAILGRTNVGKSTLINNLLARELSIVSPKKQTTQNNIKGILTDKNEQIIFIDTPGVNFLQKNILRSTLNKIAVSTIEEVDIILLVIEALKFTKEDLIYLENFKELDETTKVYLVINKIDQIAKNKLLHFVDTIKDSYPFRAIVPISALKQDNLSRLLQLIKQDLPIREHYYAPSTVTDQDEKFFISEEIRKQLLLQLYQELPHAVSITVDQVIAEVPLVVYATIWVIKESQKAIVVGKQGLRIKQIGMYARHALQTKLKKKLKLNLLVKVKN